MVLLPRPQLSKHQKYDGEDDREGEYDGDICDGHCHFVIHNFVTILMIIKKTLNFR